jgi:dienelactone hydrolase
MTSATGSGPAPTPSTGEELASRLRSFSRHEDPEAKRTEEQVFLDTPAGRLFATIVTPLGPRRGVALLSCHSFGWEQFELYPLELAFARMAAARGFPSMTFQAKGYNDSGGDFESVTPGSHVRDAIVAASHLKERAEVDAVVPVGVRFGASVALLAASDLASPGVALWAPSLAPGRYLDGLLRVLSMATIMDEDGEAGEGTRKPGMAETKGALAAGETIDLFAYPLSAACYREAHEIDPLQVRRVPPRALVVSINPGKRAEVKRVTEALAARGAEVRIEEAEGEGRGEFGMGIPRGGHLASHLPMFEDVARRTLAWAEEVW